MSKHIHKTPKRCPICKRSVGHPHDSIQHGGRVGK